jgi:hypothetical protein
MVEAVLAYWEEGEKASLVALATSHSIAESIVPEHGERPERYIAT